MKIKDPYADQAWKLQQVLTPPIHKSLKVQVPPCETS